MQFPSLFQINYNFITDFLIFFFKKKNGTKGIWCNCFIIIIIINTHTILLLFIIYYIFF